MTEKQTPGGPARRRGNFRAGEWAQLTDSRGRINTIFLQAGEIFQCHQGNVRHDDIIGKPQGCVISTQEKRERFVAMRPLLVDYHLSMPRGPQIVYPKDAAQIIVEGDIFPGARIVEAGVGSGALSMSLLNAIGASGHLLSVEKREDFAEIAKANVEMWFSGQTPPWDIEIGDLSDVLAQKVDDYSVDRVVLDMLAPWENIAEVDRVLVPGGVLACYVATVPQLSRLYESLRNSQRFTAIESWETLKRPWHVDNLAVRPEHRMIAHTGFILFARHLAPGYTPVRRTEVPGEEISPEDSLWLGEDTEWSEAACGQRAVSEKKIRRVKRDVKKRSEQMLGGGSDVE